MQVTHSRFNGFVPHRFLNGAWISTKFQRVGSVTMTEFMRQNLDAEFTTGHLDGSLDVRFVHAKSVDMLITDPDLTAELGANSITMQCPPWPLGLGPQPYSYVVTVWAERSDPSKAFYELAGRAGMILTGEKPETLNEASRHCRQKALKSEFKFSGVLTPKATVKCQFDPDVRAPNVSIWKRAPTDLEDDAPDKAP